MFLYFWKFLKIVFMLILIFVAFIILRFYFDDCMTFYRVYERFYQTDYMKNDAVMVRTSVLPEFENVDRLNAVYKFDNMEGVVLIPYLSRMLPQSALRLAKIYIYPNNELDYFSVGLLDMTGMLLLVCQDKHAIIPVYFPYEKVRLNITPDVRKKIVDQRTSFLRLDKIILSINYNSADKTEILIGTW